MSLSPPSTHVAVVGCGRWGRYIVRDLVSLGCTVTVVARSDESQQRAREHGAAAGVPGLAGLPAVMGAVVATPTATHADVVADLLRRDIPVFCEKPLATDGEDARQLAQAGAGRLFVMDKWRYHPGVERLAEIARSGELGGVIGLRCIRVQPGKVHHDVDPVWILAPHDLSIGLEILGHLPPPRAAVAERRGSELIGLVGLLGDHPWLAIEVSASHTEYRREVRLICSNGSAVLAGGYEETLRIFRSADGREAPVAQIPVGNELPLLRELRAFVEHLHGGPPPKSSAAEGAAVVQAIAHLRDLGGAAP